MKPLRLVPPIGAGEKLVDEFPQDLDELKACTPVYEEVAGWQQDISEVKNYDDLPAAAKDYVDQIEKMDRLSGNSGIGWPTS